VVNNVYGKGNIMEFEEKYKDVLQNIESAIINTYRVNPKILDNDVEDAISALARYYKAESENKTPSNPNLYELAQLIFEAVKAICEFRLGRSELNTDEGEIVSLSIMGIEPLKINEVTECLKRLQKSIRFWNKRGGTRGYLEYAGQFIP
jgi:hypothetical protein